MAGSSKIVFLIPYPVGEAPSQRFRFEQYLPLLKSKGFKITLLSFYNQSAWKILYKENVILLKIGLILTAIAKAFFNLFKTLNADYVFIHREVAPMGPPVFEWIIAKVFRKKIVYDFDDAIWHTDKKNESVLERIVRWRSKVALTCKWSHKVSCGNLYLCNYALQFNDAVILNPTTIDTTNLHNPTPYKRNKDHGSKEVVIGWTGSHSTLKYVLEIEPVIQQLENKFSFIKFLVIANKEPHMNLKSMHFLPWTKANEIQDLMKIDIGIMPLPDDEWSKGKCGFKALQYMALGIPAVVSPVGINQEIVQQGVDGFLCKTPGDWLRALEILILDEGRRIEMGSKGRQKIENRYSVTANASNFLSLFN